MKDGHPSRTAEGVARRRAAHQVLDHPTIFDDPVALRIVGRRAADLERDPSEQTPAARRLRAFMAARSRFAEDDLTRAVDRGVRQYVVLGAGLDTFAYRNPYPPGRLRVFEVDHPATQAWKRAKLAEAGIDLPADLTFTPVDFERQALADGLVCAGYDTAGPTFFSWLGVTPYLTIDSILTTLRLVAAAPGNTIVFDYSIAHSALGEGARASYAALSARVAAVGEPFRTTFDPAGLIAELRAMGFAHVENLMPDAIDARYFAGRTDDLRVGGLGALVSARV
jgi:methyltransferase (TIGR00027 family)